jgi:hypothetical protein
MKRIDQETHYSAFIRQRDKALEQLHLLAQQKQSDLMRAILSTTLNVFRQNYHALVDHSKPFTIEAVNRQLDHFYQFAAADFARIVYRLRRTTYVLSKAGESEAIARVLTKPVENKVHKQSTEEHSKKKSVVGGPVDARIKMYLDRLRRKLLSTAQMVALSQDEDGKPPSMDEFLNRIIQAMPKSRRVNVPRRILSPKLLEAKAKAPRIDASIDLIDEDEWNSMLDDYTQEFVPRWRGPESTVDETRFAISPDRERVSADELYSWELEQDLTNEFISSVRNGENDAANDAGITDFVWIAILDSKTCDDCCDGSGCSDRDGLLTSEIEEQFGDPIAPPAHFNCATAGHLISTDKGLVKIEEIKPGDLVLTDKLRFKKVERCLQSLTNQTFEIELEDGRIIEVTGEHPLMRNGQWVNASDLQVGDNLTVVAYGLENQMPMRIKSIKMKNIEQVVYNFSVEDDESYILSGVVSHNCRCRLAPALESIPDKPEVDYQSFEDWLNT